MDEMDTIDVDSPDQRLQMRKRHASIGLQMRAVALRALEELEQKVAAGQPLNLNAEDAKTLLDAGAKLERLALGEKEQEDDASLPPDSLRSRV